MYCFLVFLILQIERGFCVFCCHHAIQDHRRVNIRTTELMSALSGCEGDHQWHQRAWVGPMKSPDACSHHNHLVMHQVQLCSDTVHWYFCLNSIVNRVLAYEIKTLYTPKLDAACWESNFALVHVVVIALNLWTKSMILLVLVVGKTEITSLSCWTILSSHREWQRAGSRF